MESNVNLIDYLQSVNAANIDIVEALKRTIDEINEDPATLPEFIEQYIVNYCNEDEKEIEEMKEEVFKDVKNGEFIEMLQEQLDNYCEFYGLCKNCGVDEFYYSNSSECEVCENCGSIREYI